MFDSSALDRIINASNKRLGRVHDWPWLRSIGTIAWTANDTNGQSLETAITNFRHLNYLAYNDRKLKYEVPQKFVAQNQDTGTGPLYYTVLGSDTLYLAPNPTQDLTLSYAATLDENDLTGDTSTPLLPAAYTELLVLAALAPLAVRLADSAMLSMAKNEYKAAVIDLAAVHEGRSRTNYIAHHAYLTASQHKEKTA
jgi:hypothetical protein